MSTIPRVANAMMEVLAEVPKAKERSTGYCKRRGKLSASQFTQAIVLSVMTTPEVTLSGMVRMSANLGCGISEQGFDQRFTAESAAMLKQVLEEAVGKSIKSLGVAVPILARFTSVRVHDSTRVNLPDALKDVWRGTGGTGPVSAVKLQVSLDLRGGGLQGPLLFGAHENDQGFEWERKTPGALRMGDLGYWNVAAFEGEAEAGQYWLTRLRTAVTVLDEREERIDLVASLDRYTGDIFTAKVLLTEKIRLRARLFARRVSNEAAEQRRRKIRRIAQKNGRTAGAKQLALAGWDIYVTNVPETMLAPEEVFVLGRARWQIEILFKLWKSKARIDESRSHKPWRVLCEFYAKLIAVIVTHWVMLISFWQRVDRSVFKATDVVSHYGVAIARVIGRRDELCDLLEVIDTCLANSCRTQKRKKHPGTLQQLTELQNP